MIVFLRSVLNEISVVLVTRVIPILSSSSTYDVFVTGYISVVRDFLEWHLVGDAHKIGRNAIEG
jgi:hypothetical protein